MSREPEYAGAWRSTVQLRSTAQDRPGQSSGQGAGTTTARAAAAMSGAVLVFTAVSTAASSGGDGGGSASGGTRSEPSAPQVIITPKDGAGKAKPEKGITVKVTNGTLTTVNVAAKGAQV